MEREKPILKQLKTNLELILNEPNETVIKNILINIIDWVFRN